MKKFTAVVALAALAATAVPAMALENEFHGTVRVSGFLSNFQDSRGNNAAFAASNDERTNTYVDQRVRLLYSAKASDDLKLVTHFEIDSRWGDNAYATAGNQGAGLGADTVNIETKNAYLDFNIAPASPVNFKVGIQPFIDAYKGVFVNTDMAGALATVKLGAPTVALGWFRFDDDIVANVPGKKYRDLYVADAKFAVNPNMKVGAAYYYYRDRSRNFGPGALPPGGVLGTDEPIFPNSDLDVKFHMAGLNAEYKTDAVTFDAFAALQTGELSPNQNLTAWAAQGSAKAKVGPGTAKFAVLYTSGDNDGGHSHAWQSVQSQAGGAATADPTATALSVPGSATTFRSENSYYPADMLILLRSRYATSSDRAIVATTNNGNQGLIGAFVGYDAKLTDKAFASVNGGYMMVDKKQAGRTDSDLGIEANAEIGYKLYDNLTAQLQYAYVFLGDYWERGAVTDPKNPYLTRLMLNYTF